MKTKTVRWLMIGVLAGALAACGDDPPAEEPPVPAVAAPAPAPTADDVPVAEDFAERAEAEVTEENFRDELAAIESEVAQD